ncbi:MAG: CdaR family protein [Lachnospiraceae bacterium]|nr:CdaR family protein [Lachnospiraceae bacterium]
MGNRILKTFTNNIGYKILAVAFAFILWLVVYNLNDPVKTKTFTTTVSVTGKEAVVDMGKWPTIKESDKTVTFSVSAKRSYLSELDDSDFYADVDLSNIVVDKDDPNSATVKVDIGCTKYKHSITFNRGEHQIPVSIEEYMQKQFAVKVSLEGSVSGNRALGDNPEANPKVVKVGGPKSLVSEIASANVTVKVDENTIVADNQITDRGELIMLDENGDEVDMSKLDIDSQYKSVAISVDVLSTKEVPIKCSTTGSPAGGKSVLGVNLSEESVLIKGAAESLNSITSIDVGPIDITSATEDIKTSVDLSGYLPDNVSLVNSGKSKLSIDIQIETNATATMILNSSNISYDGVSDGHKLSFATDKTSVVVSGTQSNIDKLSGMTLRGRIDVTGLDDGTHTVTVTPNLDNAEYTWGEIKVQVIISSENEDSSDTGDSNTGNTGNTGNIGSSGNTGSSGTAGDAGDTGTTGTGSSGSNTGSNSSESKAKTTNNDGI